MAEAGIWTYGRLWVREGRGAMILKVIIMIANFWGGLLTGDFLILRFKLIWGFQVAQS